MTYARFFGAVLTLTICAGAHLQAQGNGNTRKQARAVRVANDSIRLDGRLDEEIWARGCEAVIPNGFKRL